MRTELYPGIAFSPQAVLTDNVGAADTILPVSDAAAFPAAPNLATIGTDEEGETVLYTAKTANALSGCRRGVEGTAKAWQAGAVIARNFTAKDHADLIAAMAEAASSAAAAETSAGTSAASAEAAWDRVAASSQAAEAAQLAAQTAAAAAANAKSAYQYAVEGGYTGTEAAFQKLLGDGPWLPLNGSSAMRGDLRIGTNCVVFGEDDVYLCDGDLEIAEEEVEEVAPPEVVEPEETAPLSAEVVEESVEGEIVDSEEVEEEGDAEGEAQPIQYMKLASAITGKYVPLSVGTPVRTSDAATKQYVDGLVGDIGAILDKINGEVA